MRRLSEVLFWASLWFAIIFAGLSISGPLKLTPIATAVLALAILDLALVREEKEREPSLDTR